MRFGIVLGVLGTLVAACVGRDDPVPPGRVPASQWTPLPTPITTPVAAPTAVPVATIPRNELQAVQTAQAQAQATMAAEREAGLFVGPYESIIPFPPGVQPVFTYSLVGTPMALGRVRNNSLQTRSATVEVTLLNDQAQVVGILYGRVEDVPSGHEATYQARPSGGIAGPWTIVQVRVVNDPVLPA